MERGREEGVDRGREEGVDRGREGDQPYYTVKSQSFKLQIIQTPDYSNTLPWSLRIRTHQ